MNDALHWLSSLFSRYGTIAICLAAVFGVAGLILRAIGTELTTGTAGWLFKLAGLCFALFVIMAIFFAFKV